MQMKLLSALGAKQDSSRKKNEACNASLNAKFVEPICNSFMNDLQNRFAINRTVNEIYQK